MRLLPTLLLASALAAGATPALAVRRLDLTPRFPIEHQTEGRFADQPAEPYAMTYAEEAAETLGVSHGRWDAFDAKAASGDSPFIPRVKGGIDGGGPMSRLQWIPGS